MMVLYRTQIAIVSTQSIVMKTLVKLLFRAVSMAEKYAINFSIPSPGAIQSRKIYFPASSLPTRCAITSNQPKKNKI